MSESSSPADSSMLGTVSISAKPPPLKEGPVVQQMDCSTFILHIQDGGQTTTRTLKKTVLLTS